jgi:hypothetical protein
MYKILLLNYKLLSFLSIIFILHKQRSGSDIVFDFHADPDPDLTYDPRVTNIVFFLVGMCLDSILKCDCFFDTKVILLV